VLKCKRKCNGYYGARRVCLHRAAGAQLALRCERKQSRLEGVCQDVLSFEAHELFSVRLAAVAVCCTMCAYLDASVVMVHVAVPVTNCRSPARTPFGGTSASDRNRCFVYTSSRRRFEIARAVSAPVAEDDDAR
jgi:hypothetical protein